MRKYLFYVLTSSDDPTNIRYVGTTTKTLKQRFSSHKYNATHKERRSQPVHKWMYKKMQDGFQINITEIDQCDENIWESTERKWIQYYKELGYDLLNVSEGGQGVITKEVRSKSGLQRSIDAHKHAVYALNENKEIVYFFDSINEATKFFKLKSKSSISNALKGRTSRSCGFYWVYKKDYDSGKVMIINDYDKLKNYHNKICIKVFKFNKQGTLLMKYDSLLKCSQAEKLSRNGLHSAIKNKLLFHNYYWAITDTIDIKEYTKINFPYIQYDKNQNILRKFTSYEEIAKFYNVSTSTIYRYVKEGKFFDDGTIIIKVKI